MVKIAYNNIVDWWAQNVSNRWANAIWSDQPFVDFAISSSRCHCVFLCGTLIGHKFCYVASELLYKFI